MSLARRSPGPGTMKTCPGIEHQPLTSERPVQAMKIAFLCVACAHVQHISLGHTRTFFCKIFECCASTEMRASRAIQFPRDCVTNTPSGQSRTWSQDWRDCASMIFWSPFCALTQEQGEGRTISTQSADRAVSGSISATHEPASRIDTTASLCVPPE